MTTEFDDELLSAVMDGEADPQTVAAVRADPEASQRLRSLEAAAALVATPIAPATPERRASSIAAALAAAQPAPEVSSLSVAREERAEATRRRSGVNWLAVAAALAVVLLAVPILLSITGSNSAETADTATDAAEDSIESDAAGSFAADSATSGDDSADAAEEVVEEATEEEAVMADEAMEEAFPESGDMDDAMEEEEAMEEEAMEEDPIATTTTQSSERALEPFATGSLLSLQEAIDNGLIQPVLRSTDPELLDVVAPECIDPDIDESTERFALVELGDFAPPSQLVVVQFNEDGVLIFNAEDCALVG